MRTLKPCHEKRSGTIRPLIPFVGFIQTGFPYRRQAGFIVVTAVMISTSPPQNASSNRSVATSERVSSNPVRLNYILKKWFWNVYDYLGTLILVNVLMVLCALPLITFPAGLAGLFYVTTRIASGQETGVMDFFRGFRKFFWRAQGYVLIYALVLGALAINMIFYFRMTVSWPWTGAALGGAMGWLIGFVLLTGMYTAPLMVQTSYRLRSALRTGALLTLDNIRISVGLLLFTVLTLAVATVSVAGLFSGGLSAIAALWSAGCREIRRRYADPSSEEAIDEEETRALRDLFRPWEYPR
jgi:uncharacterized membrane protein YesL